MPKRWGSVVSRRSQCGVPVSSAYRARSTWRGRHSAAGPSAVRVISALAGALVVLLGLLTILAGTFPTLHPMDLLRSLGVLRIAAGIDKLDARVVLQGSPSLPA